jgi:hypothetical protein
MNHTFAVEWMLCRQGDKNRLRGRPVTVAIENGILLDRSGNGKCSMWKFLNVSAGPSGAETSF